MDKVMIAAVVPTWNGKDTLRRTLKALAAQTRPLDEIIVVNNASTDGTLEMLTTEFPSMTTISLPENLGSAGGFAQGLKAAYNKGHTWIWLMDHDAIPNPDALEQLLKAMESYKSSSVVNVLASIWYNPATKHFEGGSLWRDRIIELPLEDNCRDLGPFPVDLAPYAGLLVKRNIVEDVGLPKPEYFIWIDDVEYCLRIRRKGYTILMVPQSIIIHEIGRRKEEKLLWRRRKRWEQKNLWRYYYATRNTFYLTAYELGSWRAVLYQLVLELKQIVGILLFDNQKLVVLKLRFLGLIDGLRGKLGKIVEPW